MSGSNTHSVSPKLHIVSFKETSPQKQLLGSSIAPAVADVTTLVSVCIKVLFTLLGSTPSPLTTLVSVYGARPISATDVTIFNHFVAPAANVPNCHIPVIKLNEPCSATYVTGANPPTGSNVTCTATLVAVKLLRFLAGIHQVVWLLFEATFAGLGLV